MQSQRVLQCEKHVTIGITPPCMQQSVVGVRLHNKNGAATAALSAPNTHARAGKFAAARTETISLQPTNR